MFYHVQKKDVSTKEDTFNLIAPSGKSIAYNLESLKAEVSDVIVKKYGSKKDFELIDIQYFPANSGYAALISYKLQDGTISNYASVSNVIYKIDSESISSLTTIKTPTTDSNLKVNGASWKVTCAGDCGCRVVGTIDPKTDILTFGCSCVGCVCTATKN